MDRGWLDERRYHVGNKRRSAMGSSESQTRHQARPLQDPRTAASKMHQMGTQRGAARRSAAVAGKQKARCRPAGWMDCGPVASVLEMLLRNRPPGRKQLTGAPSAARWRGHTAADWRCTRAPARRRPTSARLLLLLRLFQPVSLLSASLCLWFRVPVEHL